MNVPLILMLLLLMIMSRPVVNDIVKDIVI